ncbi:MAG: hypothetical protein KC996_05510 [Phycisphaerales bacterium]|nr:hypothetical protein [Phycisphaerales bacterium]
MTRTTHATGLSALAFAALLFATAGCASNRAAVIDANNGTHAAASTQALTEELAALWVSPASIEALMGTEQAGPSLVAGDWLAWQCAMTGGYFEMTPQSIALMPVQD